VSVDGMEKLYARRIAVLIVSVERVMRVSGIGFAGEEWWHSRPIYIFLFLFLQHMSGSL
jgi:hypothetical protein